MKSTVTNFTPIPSSVPRQLAIEILHSHGEVITLNPLVLEYHPIKAPRNAPNDEFYSTWYEITQRIQFVPGTGNLGSGKISFKGVFHDMPWGIQTHIYAPMSVDLRHKWSIRGNQPGEPPEARELGINAPATGLYIREDVEIKCSALTTSFVKKQLKQASAVMVDRMLKKAELLDAGVIQAMFEDGKLKTFNPADRSSVMINGPLPNTPSTPGSDWRPLSMMSQGQPGYGLGSRSPVIPSQSNSPRPDRSSQYHSPSPGLAIEMEGDNVYPDGMSQTTARPNDQHRYSMVSSSTISGDAHQGPGSVVSSSEYSQSARDSKTSSYASPAGEQRAFTAELAGSLQHPAERDSRSEGRLSVPNGRTPPVQPYNPQNYAQYQSYH